MGLSTHGGGTPASSPPQSGGESPPSTTTQSGVASPARRTSRLLASLSIASSEAAGPEPT